MKGKLKSLKGKLICWCLAVTIILATATINITQIVRYVKQNCIDMTKVIDIKASGTGFYLYTENGNEYYWSERLQIIRSTNE